MFRLVRLLSAGTLLIMSTTPLLAQAQSADNPWADPLNLSHSGVASEPSFVVDSEGVGHVIWRDDLANYVYARLDEDQWSAPVTTDLDTLFRLPVAGDEPTNAAQVEVYTGPNPLLIAGPGQFSFAFWISPQGILFTSKVNNQRFQDLLAWDTRRLITLEAASFAAAVDARGTLHLAYVRAVEDSENPAGIYYTRSKSNGTSWSPPVLLYESSYLRRLAEGEANLSLATAVVGDAVRVYVAWDNRPRKQVFLAQSANGGESWEEPALVAGPAPASGLAGPFNIHIGASQNSLLLVWQSGQPGGLCSQVYQSSRDGGATWSDPQPMFEELLGCAQANEFVAGSGNGSEDLLYFLTESQSQTYLSVWDGDQWSQPQVQPILSGFEEPEIFADVVYGCHRASMLGTRLYIVGCDEGEGGDVWVTSRELGSTAALFSSSVWSQPSPVGSENFKMETIELMATEDGSIHAFFSQRRDPAIYYTYWDGELWSRITPVLQLPDGEAGWPAIAAGPGNELFLIVPNNRGALYFSRALSESAFLASSWSTPTGLRISHDGEIGSVDAAWDASGTLYVAFSVPVNEARGIYLIMSEDQGATWSEPVQLFNGAAADFDFVGGPSLLISADGLLHITWMVQSIRGDGLPQPLALYYISSQDGGHTFSEAQAVVEEPVTWQEIVADQKGNLHLLWKSQDTNATVWDQVSLDDGLTWQFPQGLPEESMNAAITEDSVGHLHLVNAGLGSLGHWLWDGSRWQPEVPLHWSGASQQEDQVDLLAAAVNKQGKMVVVLAVPAGSEDAAEKILLYSTRTLDPVPRQTQIQNVPTQTMLPPTLIPATPTSESLSTPVNTADSGLATAQNQTVSNETSERLSPIAWALVPVLFLLLGALVVGIRQVMRARNR